MRRLLYTVFTVVALATPREARAGAMDYVESITGFLMQVIIHESGHAAMAAHYGWVIDDYRPYPNICGGKLVGGCVIMHPKESRLEADGTLNEEIDRESRAISAAGSASSSLAVLAFAPLQKVTRPSGFFGSVLAHMLWYQTYDWLFYTVIDTATGFEGDWYAVSKSLDVPTWYFIPPAALDAWLLTKYRELFARGHVAGVPVIVPRTFALADRRFGVGLDMAMQLD